MSFRRFARVTLLVAVLAIAVAGQVRRSEAFLPVPGLLLIGMTSSGAVALPTASGLGAAASWVGLSALVGAGLTHLALRDESGNEVRVPVKDPVPAPSAPATTSRITFYGVNQQGQSSGWQTSREAACASVMAAVNAGCSIEVCTGKPYSNPVVQSNGSELACYYTGSGGQVGGASFASDLQCPAGYTFSGGTCNLVNARLVTADQRRDYTRSGNTYTALTDDADAQALDAYLSGGTLRVSGTDQYGNKVTFEVTANDAGTLIKQTTQTADSAGNSTVTSKTAQLDTNGQVKETSQSTKSGNLTQDDDTQEATIESAPEGSESSGGQPCQPGVAGERACDATLQDVKTALTAKPDGDKPADPTARTQSDIEGVLPSLGLSGWAMPSHSGVCPTMTFDLAEMFGASPVIDGHCTIMESIREAVAIGFDLVWLLIALFIVLSA